ncbi:8374_t:CDS:2 [Funneliformis mosseae]|uniref:8374_t:CDS:1 n=1 Tax=Funneliformis mosseae TaxID=27381 RepID=A0A9N9GKQ9_FUNMO|nr:8374_t:CDS:2 [Funneliformis mosseae]
MKNLMKGQILDEYMIDYDKTFSEQSEKIYKKLIPELKKLMSKHFNLSVTQLLKYLLRDVLDPAANNPPKNTLKWAYDMKKIKYKEMDAKMPEYEEMLEYEVDDDYDREIQYNDTNLTDLNLDFILNLSEINLI